MGRPKNAIPSITKHVSLPEDLFARVELLLLNPITGKMKYGDFSRLIEQLLREWLDKQIQQQRDTQL